MDGFWRLISRIKDYKRNFILSIVSNVLFSIFTIISIPLLVPFFTILFDRSVPNPVVPSGNNMNDWIKYYISYLINEPGILKKGNNALELSGTKTTITDIELGFSYFNQLNLFMFGKKLPAINQQESK